MRQIDERINQLPDCDLKKALRKLKSFVGILSESQILKILEKEEPMEIKYLIELALLPVVKNNPTIFEELCKKEDWEILQELKNVLLNEFIVAHQDILFKLVGKNDKKELCVLVDSLGYEFIRNDLKYFWLIESQGYYASQYQMLQAILNEELRNDKDALSVIESYKNDPIKQQQARLNLEIKEVRKDMNLFYQLMSISDSKQQECARGKIIHRKDDPQN